MSKLKLHHEGYYDRYKIAWLYQEDHPQIPVRKEGINYVRWYKNHISIPFANRWSTGKPYRGYKKEIKQYITYLNQLGCKFIVNEKLHQNGVHHTHIKLGLDQVRIVK